MEAVGTLLKRFAAACASASRAEVHALMPELLSEQSQVGGAACRVFPGPWRRARGALLCGLVPAPEGANHTRTRHAAPALQLVVAVRGLPVAHVQGLAWRPRDLPGARRGGAASRR